MIRETKRITLYMLYCIFFICKMFISVKMLMLYIMAAGFVVGILL